MDRTARLLVRTPASLSRTNRPAPMASSRPTHMRTIRTAHRTSFKGGRPLGPISDHRNALDLDLHAWPREVGDGDERAAGVVAVGELLLAQLDEPGAVPRLLDDDRRGDEMGERDADPAQRLVDQRKHPMRLGLEVAGDVLAVAIDGRGLAGQPDDAPTLGDDGRRVRPVLLRVGALEILRHGGSFLPYPRLR